MISAKVFSNQHPLILIMKLSWKKKQRTVRMIDMAIKLLDHFKNASILPHKYILMKLVVRYIKDCYKALEHYYSIVQMNCKPRSELPFNT